MQKNVQSNLYIFLLLGVVSLCSFFFHVLKASPLLRFEETSRQAETPQNQLHVFRPRPLALTTNHVLRLGVLDPQPLSADYQGAKGFSIDTNFEYASSFLTGRTLGTPARVEIDSEFVRFDLMLETRLSKRLSTGAKLSLFHFFAGFLDDELTAYHDFFGVPNAGRETVASDRFRHVIIDTQGEQVWKGSSGDVKANDPSLWLRYAFLSLSFDQKHVLDFAGRFSLKLPLGSEGAGISSGKSDLAFGFLSSWHYAQNVAVHFNFDAIFPGDYDFAAKGDFELRDYYKTMLAFQLQLQDGFWLLSQFAWNTSLFEAPEGFQALSDQVILGSFGVLFTFDRFQFHLGLNEDITAEAEADFSTFFGVSTTW